MQLTYFPECNWDHQHQQNIEKKRLLIPKNILNNSTMLIHKMFLLKCNT